MKLQAAPARQGAVWVRQGFAVFLKQPIAFAALFAVFLFAVLGFSLLPLIGPLLLLMLLPIASLGFMIATRNALDGRFPLPRAFIAPLRAGRTQTLALLKLGLVYAVATFLIMWLSDIADGGALDALMATLPDSQTTPEVVAGKLADPRLEVGLLLRLGLAALLSVPFWHAPALIHWGGVGWGKALFFSCVACWRNKAAFAIYSLTWAAVLLVFAVVANLVFGLFGNTQLMALAAMPASLIFSTIFYASLYFTFSGCFAPIPDEPLPVSQVH